MPEVLATTWQFDKAFLARPLPTAAMVAVVLGIALLTIYLYRHSWGLPAWLRVTLAGVRFLVLAVVAATLLEPMVVVNETIIQPRRLPILVDVSQSMSMQDSRQQSADLLEAAVALNLLEPNDSLAVDQATLALTAKQRQAIASASRLDLATTLLSGAAQPTLLSLSENLDVSYHTFGNTTQLLTDNTQHVASTVNELVATAPQTSLADSLESVANAGGIPPAGIVVLTDGIDNVNSSRSEAVIRDLGTRGIPVYPVPIGLANPDDVSISNIVMQEVAYSGDLVPVRVQIESKGYEKRSARLVVLLNGRRVSQSNFELDGGLQFEDVSFRVDVYEKGAAEIEIAVEPFDDEISIENNRVERSIRIVNEQVNVLYIEGNARWEYRYLRAILKRDPRINATFIASNAGPEIARNSVEHIERFPNDRDEAFQYDLVILGDVDAAFFKSDELQLLEELIRDRGASLLMLCGPMHSPGTYADTVVARMLPIRFDSDAPWEEVSESAYPVLTPEGHSSLVMTLENETEANNRVWTRAAPLDHLPPLVGAKPGATVLATLSEKGSMVERYPLVAWQRYGTGKCMTIATDRLWRLRYMTGDKYHWRIWSQCIQFMTLSRLMGEHKRIRLETDRSIYAVGSQCRLYAQVLDEDYEPVLQSRFDIVVSGLGDIDLKESISLRPDRARAGLYEGYFAPPVAGRYRVEANQDDQSLSNTTEFQVTIVNQEMADPNMQLDTLERIANLTGGECLSVGEFAKLQTLVDIEPLTTTVQSERSLWDNGWLALVLIGLVGVEWILRRKHDLP